MEENKWLDIHSSLHELDHKQYLYDTSTFRIFGWGISADSIKCKKAYNPLPLNKKLREKKESTPSHIAQYGSCQGSFTMQEACTCQKFSVHFFPKQLNLPYL
jgi:hypothetical protein